MALRYLPTMAGVFRTISEAQQARALDLTRGGPLRRARAYIPITVAMLISALRTAQHLSYALESRALGALPRRTYLHRLRCRPLDAAYAAAILLLTLAYAWARLAYGLGAHPLAL
jgi:energy-coupling factor transport system permease protein